MTGVDPEQGTWSMHCVRRKGTGGGVRVAGGRGEEELCAVQCNEGEVLAGGGAGAREAEEEEWGGGEERPEGQEIKGGGGGGEFRVGVRRGEDVGGGGASEGDREGAGSVG